MRYKVHVKGARWKAYGMAGRNHLRERTLGKSVSSVLALHGDNGIYGRNREKVCARSLEMGCWTAAGGGGDGRAHRYIRLFHFAAMNP